VSDSGYWDAQAAVFDDDPDHGLRDPAVRRAWRELLAPCLPALPARVLDAGCGTGSLAVLLGEQGYDLTGVDIAPRMVERARAKAARAGVAARFVVADATDPPPAQRPYDVVLCRHVLWALPDPDAALRRWVDLLASAGRLVLVEGRWSAGGGLGAEELQRLVLRHRSEADVVRLPDPALWGRPIDDERYLLVSRR
jgi:SAM-dependent methyltransferase